MIGRVLAFCCLAILSGCATTSWGPALTRAEPPDLSIVVARDAASAVRHAAEELQLYL
ncbi:MAG: hypothetical protein HYZ00_12525, partial [Candidatus Hydrogenedentes bacterium]|nr:hypothetical protein [Candidatus Hydrogenedentota bacterium]